MPDVPASMAPRAHRDLRLDLFRGLALAMIYINHVPGTIYEHLTSRNFGLSDAAEGFVLMSGIAAGLAYSPAFRQAPYWPGVGRVWYRVWTLYLVHLFMTVFALAIAAGAALWFGAWDRLQLNEMHVLFDAPLGFLIGVPLLTHQLGYVNILPMYAVMLAFAPAMLWLALRRPYALVAGSGLLWLLGGLLQWNLPNFPNPGGWFFNPIAWQFLFVTGLATGVAARQGKRLVAIKPWLQWLAGTVVLVGLVWSKVPIVFETFNHLMWLASQAGAPRFFTITDKTFETWPRLVHILALAYILSTLAWVREFSASRWAQPFVVLGRNALPVFAFGTLLALVAQAIKEIAPVSLGLDTALILGGLAAQFLLAWSRDRLSLKPR
jgi:hypothetical protein